MRIERDHMVTLAIVAGLLALFAFGVWRPTTAEQADLGQRLADAEQRAQENAQKTLGVKNLAVEVASLEARAARHRRVIPAESEIAEMVRELSAELARRDIHDKSIETRLVAHYEGFKRAPVSLRFNGTFADAHAILRKVESMSRLVTVASVEMERVGSGSRDRKRNKTEASPNTLEVFIDLHAFHIGQPEGKQP